MSLTEVFLSLPLSVIQKVSKKRNEYVKMTERELSKSSTLVYRIATEEDSESLTNLVNISYSGELSNQGWTNENGLVTGPRTTVEKISNIIKNDQFIILMFFDPNNHQHLIGCISIQHKSESKIACLSTFSVRPDQQARGYGKFILNTAETYSRDQWNVESIELNVITQRFELIAYYNRRGYVDTGRREAFTVEQCQSDSSACCTLERCFMRKII